jgi:hypothetical protein
MTGINTERVAKLRYDPLWRLKMIFNGFGALCTALVMMVFAVTKFRTARMWF